MYRMLIVEDEPATMEGIKSAVNWSLLDITICGEATNGLQAFQMIGDLQPDIILCDIHMPKMDGITLINRIQSTHPNTEVIFISGYSDKAYLKNAIRLNVIDYIYKPIELAELIQAVEKAKTACDKNHVLGASLDNNIALNLIHGWTSTSTLHNLPIDLDDYLITIIVRFDMNLDIALETEILTIHQYLPSFHHLFSQLFGGRYVLSNINNGYVLHANVSKAFPWDTEKNNRLNGIFNIVKEHSRYVTVGISNPVKSSIYLRDSYAQARSAALSAFLTGYGNLIFYKNLSTEPFVPSEDLESQFFAQINTNNMASSIDFLEEYMVYMSSCRPEDIPAIKDELVRISFRLNQRLKGNRHIQREYVTQTINHALNITYIKEYLLKLLDQIFTDINSLNNKGRIIFDAEKYIMANYDQDLSINKIAESVFVTPTYLSHLYKMKTGRTINQFILEVRMNKSKRLITDTSLKLSEIAEKIGYNNQSYFTKTFTKYFGVNPSEFRNKRLK